MASGGGSAVKRAISLPRAQHERLVRIARAKAMPYSAVVQAAVRLLLDREDQLELVEAYRGYYAAPENAARARAAVGDFQSLGRRAWD